jgi:hypothetical protein
MHGPVSLLLSPLHPMQTMVRCVSRALSTDECDVHLLDWSVSRTTTQSHMCKRPHLMTSALLFGRAQAFVSFLCSASQATKPFAQMTYLSRQNASDSSTGFFFLLFFFARFLNPFNPGVAGYPSVTYPVLAHDGTIIACQKHHEIRKNEKNGSNDGFALCAFWKSESKLTKNVTVTRRAREFSSFPSCVCVCVVPFV